MKTHPYPYKTIEEALQIVLKQSQHGSVSLKTIFDIFSEKGRFILLFFLSLPFCQPIQLPGMSIPFGILVAFLGFRIAFGHHLWLPKSLLEKTLSPTTIRKIVDKCLWLIKKMKPWIHPRLSQLCHHPIALTVNGILIVLLGIFLALPLPIPFSNIIIAWPILLISLGSVEDDGVLVIIGYCIFLLCLIFFLFIGYSVFFLTHPH